MKPEVVAQLQAYRQKDKFSPDAWEERGLHPSPEETCLAMSAVVNDCLDELLSKAVKRTSKAELREILSKGLTKGTYSYYDTEEREFICLCFAHIARILGINFGTELNEFLYGEELALSIALQKMQPKVYQIRTQPCATCGIELETLVIEQADIPEFSWFIVQCNYCQDYNLLSVGENVSEMKSGNYVFIEQIRKDLFTKEEAQAKLTEVKNK